MSSVVKSFLCSFFQVDTVHIGSGNLFLIAGPCVIESEKHALFMAEVIKGVTRSLNVPFIFKASYDKANRTSIRSFRGPGLERRPPHPAKSERRSPRPRAHRRSRGRRRAPKSPKSPMSCKSPLSSAARPICRRRRHDRAAVNIKKGQFVSPWDMKHAVEKCRAAGNDRVFVTERGSSFGYNNLVVDMRSLAIMRKFAPVVFDATHSVQLPSASGDGDHAGQRRTARIHSVVVARSCRRRSRRRVHGSPRQPQRSQIRRRECPGSTKLREVLKELLAVQRAVGEAHAKP